MTKRPPVAAVEFGALFAVRTIDEGSATFTEATILHDVLKTRIKRDLRAVLIEQPFLRRVGDVSHSHTLSVSTSGRWSECEYNLPPAPAPVVTPLKVATILMRQLAPVYTFARINPENVFHA
jgi:hypothetical protein